MVNYIKKIKKYEYKLFQLGGEFEIIENEIISPQKIKCNYDKVIGTGSYGKVILCNYENKQNMFIEKIFSNENNYEKELKTATQFKSYLKKCKILYPIAKNNKENGIIYNYKGITLNKFITPPKEMTNFNYINIIIQVLDDLSCIYKEKIINTDLKIENIVITPIKFYITTEYKKSNNLFLYMDPTTDEILIATISIIDIDSFIKVPENIRTLLKIPNIHYTISVNASYWTALSNINITNDIPPLYGIASLISSCLLFESSKILQTYEYYNNILEKCKKINPNIAKILESCVMHNIIHHNPYVYIKEKLSEHIPIILKKDNLEEYIKSHNTKYKNNYEPVIVTDKSLGNITPKTNLSPVSTSNESYVDPKLLEQWGKLIL